MSSLLICSIVFVSGSLAMGGSQTDWSSVESLVGQEVAVKLSGGTMKYGIMRSVAPDSFVIQVAGAKSLTQTETTINRAEVKKVWRALLFVNERNTGKGAAIGAGVGALALGVPAIAAGRGDDQVDNGLAGAGFLLGALGGAAVGGIAGFFSKKKHKKRDLIYKQ